MHLSNFFFAVLDITGGVVIVFWTIALIAVYVRR